MALYCGIDLHSTNCWISIIDEERKVVREKKLGNDLKGAWHALAYLRFIHR